MRNELGIVLVELPDGKVEVQCFQCPAKAVEWFRQLKELPDKTESRATFVSLDWSSGEVFASALSKTLPQGKQEKYFGYKLGVGPVQESDFNKQV
jgi:hypothetical protein